MDIHGAHPLRDYFRVAVHCRWLNLRHGWEERGGVRFDERDMGRPNDIPGRTWGFCMRPPFARGPHPPSCANRTWKVESVGWWECEVISPNNGIIAMTNGCPRIPCVRADEFPHLMRFIDFRQEERGKREKCERARERERKKMTPPPFKFPQIESKHASATPIHGASKVHIGQTSCLLRTRAVRVSGCSTRAGLVFTKYGLE